MINFRDSSAAGASLVIVAAAVALAATLAYSLLVPKPSAARIVTQHRQNEARIIKEVGETRKELAGLDAGIARQTWNVPAQEVAPAALAKVTGLARANMVKLAGFRPQRGSQEGDVELLPFLLTAEGSYPDVMSFVRAVETPSNKLAVNLLQLASTDGSSDRVTATVGLVAFRKIGQEEKRG